MVPMTKLLDYTFNRNPVLWAKGEPHLEMLHAVLEAHKEAIIGRRTVHDPLRDKLMANQTLRNVRQWGLSCSSR